MITEKSANKKSKESGSLIYKHAISLLEDLEERRLTHRMKNVWQAANALSNPPLMSLFDLDQFHRVAPYMFAIERTTSDLGGNVMLWAGDTVREFSGFEGDPVPIASLMPAEVWRRISAVTADYSVSSWPNFVSGSVTRSGRDLVRYRCVIFPVKDIGNSSQLFIGALNYRIFETSGY